MLICPLCLREFSPPIYLYCPGHGNWFPWTSQNAQVDLADLNCPGCVKAENEGRLPLEIQRRPIVMHKMCRCESPLIGCTGYKLDRNTLSISGEAIQVSHWELASLWEAAIHYPACRAMWCPLDLLLTTNQVMDRNLSEPMGKRILLAGPSQVGKTVLATMALYEGSYSKEQLSQLENFAYVSPSQSASEPWDEFAKALVPLQALSKWNPVSAPPSTAAECRHVRAAIFPRWKRTASRERWFHRTLASREHCGSVVFYDFAGEKFETSGNPELRDFYARCQVLTAVVDATHLRRRNSRQRNEANPPGPSIAAAASLLRARVQQRCLVVTKADLVPELISELEKKECDASESARFLVSDWLNDDGAEGALKRELEGVPVFFVWTENLRGGVLPIPHHVQDFVEWCLNLSLRWN